MRSIRDAFVDLYKERDARLETSARGHAVQRGAYARCEPVAAPNAQAERSIENARPMRFRPLESAESAMAAGVTGGGAHCAIAVPKVVRMILDDCGEHWLRLARSLQERSISTGLRTVVVTGSQRGEGYTTIATALAVALAEHTDRKVLLMDGNVTAPQIAKRLRIKRSIGLEHIVLENLPVDQALVRGRKPKLSVMPLVEGFQYPNLLTENNRLSFVMESLRSHFDLVVVDGGSVFSNRDGNPLLSGIDAAMIVRNPQKSSEVQLEQTDAYLHSLGISSLGVVENGIE